MDIYNNNLKIYTFKLDINNPAEYVLFQHPEFYQHYLNCTISSCKAYCVEIDNFNLRHNPKGNIYSAQFFTLYDINNNKPNKINLLSNNINCKLYLESTRPTNNFKSFEISKSLEKNNIYIKQIYDDNTMQIDDISNLQGVILNHKLIHILIDNFCKLHYIKNIKVTLHSYNPSVSLEFLETITFIIDETKESNNRKIKFYEHFSDFYRTTNNDVNYKIIQQPIGDGYCLIEELDSIKNITQNIEIKKTQKDIFAEKDAEIDKLKKEIEELKKFYINS
jgi:hypothetical protein